MFTGRFREGVSRRAGAARGSGGGGVLGHSAGYFDFLFKGHSCTYTAWNLVITKG